jgi:hypothetical protein
VVKFFPSLLLRTGGHLKATLLYYRQRHLLVLSLYGIIHLHGYAVCYLAGKKNPTTK